MFDVGWSELFLIMAVAVLVIGPEEIPKVMQTLGRIVRRLQYVKYAFSQQFEDFMKDAGMDDLRKQVNFEEKDFNAKDFDESESDEEFLNEPKSEVGNDR
jgi:sec-independent protein translocase protein TatB